jgi:uncharacterized membrane protein YgdD (TMEM256/DUF423 family)
MINYMDRTFLLIGSILGFLGVAFGAFGAHGLRHRLSPEMLAVFETGVRYQMYHVFAVLIVAAAIGHLGNARLLTAAGWAFSAGTLLFSGSLYALALTNVTTLGAITPIGGVLFLAGWALLGIFAIGSIGR